MSSTAIAIATLGTTAPPLRSPWTTFGLVAVAVFLVSLDATIVLAAFPALRDAFAGTSPAALSWVLNAYTITYAALLVPAGRLPTPPTSSCVEVCFGTTGQR